MEPAIFIQAIILLGGVFTGFFALIKYLQDKSDKRDERFLQYVKENDGHVRDVAQRFAETIDRKHEILVGVTNQLASMKETDLKVLEAIGRNNDTIDRAVSVIELKEKREALKDMKKMHDEMTADSSGK